MVIVILLAHFGPSIYWGARGTTFVAPLLWSLIGATYSATASSRPTDPVSAWAYMRQKRSTRLLRAAFTGLVLSAILNITGYLMGLAASHSAGAVKIVEALVFGYLLAGLHYLLCNLRRPPIRQPAFARPGSRTASSLIVGMLLWLPPSFFNLRWGRGQTFSETLLTWVIFVVAAYALASI